MKGTEDSGSVVRTFESREKCGSLSRVGASKIESWAENIKDGPAPVTNEDSVEVRGAHLLKTAKGAAASVV